MNDQGDSPVSSVGLRGRGLWVSGARVANIETSSDLGRKCQEVVVGRPGLEPGTLGLKVSATERCADFLER